jgi:hypothetical protein
METEMIEYNELIADRVKGQGDTWILVNDKTQTIHKSLTDALEAWFQVATTKPTAFRLDLANGNIFAILLSEVEIIKPKPKTFNLYGE